MGKLLAIHQASYHTATIMAALAQPVVACAKPRDCVLQNLRHDRFHPRRTPYYG